MANKSGFDTGHLIKTHLHLVYQDEIADLQEKLATKKISQDEFDSRSYALLDELQEDLEEAGL